jgi:hypothetical protein
VASPGRDTCHTDLALLAYDRTSTEVTRVTTHRVTRGRMTSSDDMAADRAYGMLTQQDRWQYGRMTGGVRWVMWHTRGPITG